MKKVLKRDGTTLQAFKTSKLAVAITKAARSVGTKLDAETLIDVINNIEGSLPDVAPVEAIQDVVESELMRCGHFDIAKAYILYRQNRTAAREARQSPDPLAISNYIHAAKYARYRPDLGRRETYEETVARVEAMHRRRFPELTPEIQWAFDLVRAKRVLPSMRSMQFAGPAIEANHCRQYNCSATPIDRTEVFGQALFLLLSGCGVGYSVQRRHVDKLPSLATVDERVVKHWVIEDSIEGWADALSALVHSFVDGTNIEFSYHLIRPAGTPLKTSGGRAPGHRKLKASLERIRSVLMGAQGRQLRPIECHRIMCHAADAVLSGGIRRCLPEGTLVHTSQGLRPIESLRVGDVVRTHGGYSNVTEVMDQGVQKLAHIQTQTGVFKCTPNHRVAVLTSPNEYTFKQAKDLKSGDRLVFVDHVLTGTKTSLPGWGYERSPYDHTSVDITIPELDVEMAWLLGYLHGNGHVHVNRTSSQGGSNFVAFAMNSEDQETGDRVERLRGVLERFSVNVSSYKVQGENTIVVRASGKQLSLYMENFKRPNTPLEVPECILQGFPEIRASYLAGLFDADGAANNRPLLLVSSVYSQFLTQVQAVYASLGIPSRLMLNRKATVNWQDMFHLNLVGRTPRRRFIEQVGKFANKHVDSEKQSQRDYGYPREWVLDQGVKFGSRWSPTSRQMTVDTFEACGGDRSHITPIEVVGVSLTEEEAHTYDISVEGAHEFVANGLLVHNSAMICLFDLDDRGMLAAKTGNWYETDPWFANANNSVVLKRDEVSEEDFKAIFNLTKQWGEPGFHFVNDKDHLTNPCVPEGTRILTREGYVPIESRVGLETVIWNGVEWCAVTPSVTGHGQPMVRVRLSDGTHLDCTTSHEWCVADGQWSRDRREVRVKAKDLKPGQKLFRYEMPVVEGGEDMLHAYTHGFFCADGMVHDKQNVALLYGEKMDLLDKLSHSRWSKNENPVRIRAVLPEGLPGKTFVPMNASVRSKLEWFAGLLDGDGTTVFNPNSSGLQVCSINNTFLQDVRLMLTTLGVQAKISLPRKGGVRELPDGRGGKKEYLVQDSWRLLLNAADTHKLVQLGLETHRIDLSMSQTAPQRDARRFVRVESVESLPAAATVYCFTEPRNHTGTFEGIVTGQCSEIGLYPFIDVTGEKQSGVAVCNLTEINASKFRSYEDFEESARAATFIGTLQASYTDMPYLGRVSEEIVRRDALLGVSITGMFDAPDIACNPEYQRKIAGKIKTWNAEYAMRIGINAGARLCCVKPSGTASLELGGVASGHHPHHARRYIRRVTANELEPVFQAFKAVNPHMCVRKPNGDYVIEFPVEAPQGAIVKSDLDSIQFLEMVKSTQQNWVIPGSNSTDMTHNVSNTVVVQPDDWDKVAEYLWENREYFTGVSLLAASGDKDFAFAPMEEVKTDADEARWNDLISHYRPVDYEQLTETTDTTKLAGEAACAGGVCEVTI